MMKLLKSKSGKLSTGSLNTIILAIVLLVVVFNLYAELVPEAQTAGDSLNTSLSGETLGPLFVSGGVVFVIIMAALLITVVKSFMPGGK